MDQNFPATAYVITADQLIGLDRQLETMRMSADARAAFFKQMKPISLADGPSTTTREYDALCQLFEVIYTEYRASRIHERPLQACGILRRNAKNEKRDYRVGLTPMGERILLHAKRLSEEARTP